MRRRFSRRRRRRVPTSWYRVATRLQNTQTFFDGAPGTTNVQSGHIIFNPQELWRDPIAGNIVIPTTDQRYTVQRIHLAMCTSLKQTAHLAAPEINFNLHFGIGVVDKTIATTALPDPVLGFIDDRSFDWMFLHQEVWDVSGSATSDTLGFPQSFSPAAQFDVRSKRKVTETELVVLFIRASVMQSGGVVLDADIDWLFDIQTSCLFTRTVK